MPYRRDVWQDSAHVKTEQVVRVGGVPRYQELDLAGAVTLDRLATAEERAALREDEDQQQDTTDTAFIDSELAKALPDAKQVLLRMARLLRRRGVLGQ